MHYLACTIGKERQISRFCLIQRSHRISLHELLRGISFQPYPEQLEYALSKTRTLRGEIAFPTPQIMRIELVFYVFFQPFAGKRFLFQQATLRGIYIIIRYFVMFGENPA